MMREYLRGLRSKARRSDWGKQYGEIKSIITEDKLASFQEKYLERLLLHTYHNVPHYTKIFEEIALVKNDKLDLSKFNEIPILIFSGGSTGEPVRFIQDDSYDKWGATLHYWYKDILGIDESSARKIILKHRRGNICISNLCFEDNKRRAQRGKIKNENSYPSSAVSAEVACGNGNSNI